MRLRVAVLTGALVLLAGCAAPPERPDVATAAKPPAPKPAATSAHLFDGCHVLDLRLAHSYILTCGPITAEVLGTAGIAPDAFVKTQVGNYEKEMPGLVQAPKGHITIAGVPHPATLVMDFAHPGDITPIWSGVLVPLSDEPLGRRMVSCTTKAPGDPARCKQMIPWMATHAGPPKGGGVVRAEHAWPSKRDLDSLEGCTKSGAVDQLVMLRCGGAALVIMRIKKTLVAPAGYRILLDAAIDKEAAILQRKGSTKLVRTDLECRLAGRPAACIRLEVRANAMPIDILMAVGNLFGATVMAECTELGEGPGSSRGCSTLIQTLKPGAGAEPQSKPPADTPR